MTPRIDFFIAGVQKGATTALWSFLQSHPRLELSAKKEIHIFDADQFDWSEPNYRRLHNHFDWTRTDVVRGEATPIYTYWLSALPRIRAYNPDAKFIVCLRHPTFRAFSHWRMVVKWQKEVLTFEEATSAEGRERVERGPNGQDRLYSYVERGFYAAEIERLTGMFPRANVLFVKSDHLWTRTADVLATAERFLGVEPFLAEAVARQYVVPLDSRDVGEIPAASRERLDELYRADVIRTAELTGLDLADWLDPHYVEPTHADRHQTAQGADAERRIRGADPIRPQKAEVRDKRPRQGS